MYSYRWAPPLKSPALLIATLVGACIFFIDPLFGDTFPFLDTHARLVSVIGFSIMIYCLVWELVSCFFTCNLIVKRLRLFMLFSFSGMLIADGYYAFLSPLMLGYGLLGLGMISFLWRRLIPNTKLLFSLLAYKNKERKRQAEAGRKN